MSRGSRAALILAAVCVACGGDTTVVRPSNSAEDAGSGSVVPQAGAGGGSYGLAGQGGAHRGGGAAGDFAGAAGLAVEAPGSCWAHIYSTGAFFEHGSALIAAPDGGIWVSGTRYQVENDPWRAMVLHTDQAGDPSWGYEYGVESVWIGAEMPLALGDGGLLLAGGRTDALGLLADPWLLRLNSNGSPVWVAYFDVQPSWGVARCVRDALDGGFVVAGDAAGHAWLAKLSADGQVEWQTTYAAAEHDHFVDVQRLEDGYLLTGAIGGPALTQSTSAWIARIAADGALLWSNQIDVGRGWLQQAHRLDGGNILAVGNVFLADGAESQDGWLLEFDAAGRIVSSRSYGTDVWDRIRNTDLDAEGGLLVGGQTDWAGDAMRSFNARIAPSGEVEWARRYGDGMRLWTAGPARAFGGSVWDDQSGSDVLVARLGTDGTCDALPAEDIPLTGSSFPVEAVDVDVTAEEASFPVLSESIEVTELSVDVTPFR